MRDDSNKPLKNGSIKLFILIQLVIVIAFTGILVFSFSVFYKSAKDNTIQLKKTTLNETNEKLNNFLLKNIDVVSSAADNISYMIQNKYTHAEISEYITHLSQSDKIKKSCGISKFYGYFCGEYIDSTGSISENEYSPYNREWFINACNSRGEVSILPSHYDDHTGSFILSISKLLDDYSSVLAADIPLDELKFFAKTLFSDKKSEEAIFVINQFGTVIAHTEELQSGKNYIAISNSEDSLLALKILSTPEAEFNTTYQKKRIHVISRENKLSGWKVVILTDRSQIFINTIKNQIGVLFGLSLLFAIVTYFCSSNFRARIKMTKYAAMLNKYKSDLEHQVVDQWNQLDKNKNALEQKTHDLVKMQENVIEGMATIIEYRDVNTGMHVQNTKFYVLLITNYLFEHNMHSDEVNEKYVSMIGNAAAMHDIGKVAISDRILNKPEKLDNDEYEMMKQHTILGAGLVRQVFGNSIDEDMLRICIDVVQYHHEKWDGTGYPIGLEKEDIPLSARIMAIADCFDAIASKRVYKPAFPMEEVFEIIKKESGTHFDPELTEIFLTMKDQIKAHLNKSLI